MQVLGFYALTTRTSQARSMVLGLRVYGLGVLGSGFRVLGFRVSGSGFTVLGSGLGF